MVKSITKRHRELESKHKKQTSMVEHKKETVDNAIVKVKNSKNNSTNKNNAIEKHGKDE